jgi:DNA-directed RNA polymerase specialized sigma24 family protein
VSGKDSGGSGTLARLKGQVNGDLDAAKLGGEVGPSAAERQYGGLGHLDARSGREEQRLKEVDLARAKAMKDLRPTEFVALASRAIRNVLVDRAREGGAVKRGGRLRRVTLNGASLAIDGEVDLLRLDVALQKLALIDERQFRVVELRFFGGLSHEDIGRILECSARTINSEWAMAKTWLHRELERG